MTQPFNCEYIVVQAGGKGTRLKHLTANKPKALVPVNNLPLIFHLFKQFPDKRFVIIGDYKCDVLAKYINAFSKVMHIIVDAQGAQGTCGGVQQAMHYIPKGSPFMFIWCDLVLPKSFSLPVNNGDYIGISKDFCCRWRYEKGVFEEVPSTAQGVAGLFIFTDKEKLAHVPAEGEFVRWLGSTGIAFDELPLHGTREFGVLEEYETQKQMHVRPFNRITECDGQLIKEGIDEQGHQLAIREKAWYKHAQKLGITAIPHIYNYEPLTMEKIDGKNIFEYALTPAQRSDILDKLINALCTLHQADTDKITTDYFSLQDAYITKTFARLDSIRNLIPFANEPYITVNGRKCRNIYFNREILQQKMTRYIPPAFCFIHGDCTFHNMMLRNGAEPVLIDPRGYFGHTRLYGDPNYDWAKLYYSIAGNYDAFNRKQFTLTINADNVQLDIASNGWEDMTDEMFTRLGAGVCKESIKLIHAIIWLSLTTYAWEDYDSVCGAFYNGLLYLEEEIWG